MQRVLLDCVGAEGRDGCRYSRAVMSPFWDAGPAALVLLVLLRLRPSKGWIPALLQSA